MVMVMRVMMRVMMVLMTIMNRFVFATAPSNTRDVMSMNQLYHFAATYAMKRPVAINIRLPAHPPQNLVDLSLLCYKYNILDLYAWLAQRFPKYFVEKELSIQQRAHAGSLIQRTLESPQLRAAISLMREYNSVLYVMMEKSGSEDRRSAHVPPANPAFDHVRALCLELLLKIPEDELTNFSHCGKKSPLQREISENNHHEQHHRGQHKNHRRHDKHHHHQTQQQQNDSSSSSTKQMPRDENGEVVFRRLNAHAPQSHQHIVKKRSDREDVIGRQHEPAPGAQIYKLL